jgi:hypothetical protein
VAERKQRTVVHTAGGGAVYGLGFIGALVYYEQQAGNVGQVIVALFRALVWPALLVYHLLTFIS